MCTFNFSFLSMFPTVSSGRYAQRGTFIDEIGFIIFCFIYFVLYFKKKHRFWAGVFFFENPHLLVSY